MKLSEILCPACKTTNELKPLYVGAACQAGRSFMESGHKTKTTDMQALTPEIIIDWLSREVKEAVVPESGIAF